MIAHLAAAGDNPGIVVGWYNPVAIAVNVYLLVVSLCFIGWFRPRSQRGMVAYGIWLTAAALAWGAVPTLYRIVFSGLPPTTITSEWWAVHTVAPRAVMGVAVTMWAAWLLRARRERIAGHTLDEVLSEPRSR